MRITSPHRSLERLRRFLAVGPTLLVAVLGVAVVAPAHAAVATGLFAYAHGAASSATSGVSHN